MEDLLKQDPVKAAVQQMQRLMHGMRAAGACQALVSLAQEHGVVVTHARMDEGTTPLHFMCGLGLGEYAELCVARGADNKAQNCFGRTALFDAAASGNMRCVRAAMGEGVRVRDQHGISVLATASYRGHKDVVKVLVTEVPTVRDRVEDADNALRNATRYGRKEVVRVLLDAGVDGRKVVRGESIIEVAKRRGHAELAEWLRKRLG